MKESVFAGVVVPALQSLVTGLFSGLAAWALGLLNNWEQSGLTALAIGAGVALLTWTIAARHWQRVLELQSGVDLQPDSLPGAEPESITRVTVVNQEGTSGAKERNFHCFFHIFSFWVEKFNLSFVRP